MTTGTWHAPPELLARYAVAPEAVDDPTASSVETHLLSCAECRRVVASAVAPGALAASWAAVAQVVDRPRRTAVERLLHRLGIAETTARVVAATPSLQLAWLGAMATVVAAVVAVARAGGPEGPFLVVAPLVPLASVAAAFPPGAEPAGEVAAATPTAGLGLLLRRAVAVLIATLAVVVPGALALPGLDLADAAWVLPALALSSGALALGTWVRAEVAAAGLGTAWLFAVWVAMRIQHVPVPTADLAPLALPGQVVAGAVIALAVPVILARRHTLAFLLDDGGPR